MSRVLSISLLIQLLLIAGFLGFSWQADQVMDKSGIGDIEAWRRFNALSGIAFYGVTFVWLATIMLSLVIRLFRTSKAQLAIGLPPLALILGWCLP
ncbi:MAG: hypothetical protein V2I38_07560 [Alcanivoracaceae bacterium]|jgi:hypothetical protein|nr:hypothetical protein [Alcanivoracaceae bacterium]